MLILPHAQVVMWAINQQRTDHLLKAMKDIGVPFRLMEGTGDDGKGSIKTWSQLNGEIDYSDMFFMFSNISIKISC